ncbi:hypothetical protein DFJ74DRAFT_664171 [Hyaloraphidium curvatum]|nr:hypothetical protein DFJ74DRAFT_664171 [Hyaloraphidium curvatum]
MAEGEPERVRNAGGPPVLAEFAPSDRAAGLLAVATANSIMVLKRGFRGRGEGRAAGLNGGEGPRVSLLGGPVTAAISHAPERVEHPQVSGPCRVVAVAQTPASVHLPLPTPPPRRTILARHRLPSPALSLSFHPQHRHILLCACGDGAKVLEWRSGSWAWSCAPFPARGARTGNGGRRGRWWSRRRGKWGFVPEGGLLRWARIRGPATPSHRPFALATDLRPGTSELAALQSGLQEWVQRILPKPIPIPMPGVDGPP